MPLLRDSEPGDDLGGFPCAIELNEPRVPISDLGFTEGYPLLDEWLFTHSLRPRRPRTRR